MLEPVHRGIGRQCIGNSDIHILSWKARRLAVTVSATEDNRVLTLREKLTCWSGQGGRLCLPELQFLQS